ncbi:MAG: adenylate/guanylate cyclase domain-containing protein [Planctomycetota bacterium]
MNRLSIQSKMILLLLLVSLLSIGIIAWTAYLSAKSALVHQIENQLTGVRAAKTATLKAMLEGLRDQVIAISDSVAAIEGTKAFIQAYRELDAAQLSEVEAAKLTGFYSAEFLPALQANLDGKPVLEQYLPTGNAARYLQYHYIVANDQPYEQNHLLEQSTSDQSRYSQVHTQYHRLFDRAAKIFGFEDILLVDADTLDIVYSYQKTTEFGTNLATGPYSNTLMAEKVRSMRSLRDRDDFKIADFEPYRPSLGKPMGFAVSPIFDGSRNVGLLVLQFPINSFNKVLTGVDELKAESSEVTGIWKAEGLGETGEVYLVGPDKTMRSRSRFMIEQPEGFLQTLRANGMSERVVKEIQAKGNVICSLPIDSESAAEALRGRSGLMEVTDYRNQKVLSAYGPLELDSLRWGVLAELDKDEAEAPIRKLGRDILNLASGIALAVTLLALAFSSMLTRPLRLLTQGARRLGAGETNVKVQIDSRDEFGELGKVFNQMAESIRSQTDKLESQVRENQELLLSILPASAVAQRQEGDERASRQFADVSVLFAEIQGMEELGHELGDSKALSILGDLISAFDEAAEKFGIEKVKTIGGSYLAVCGLSVNRPDHARRVIQFAQEMGKTITIFNREQTADLHLAVGVNAGPVVGGVVGRRKFLYDLWGDTVAIAKRLAGSPGAAIRVTRPVRDRLGEQFQFSGPVSVELPGKEPLEAWQVTA